MKQIRFVLHWTLKSKKLTYPIVKTQKRIKILFVMLMIHFTF